MTDLQRQRAKHRRERASLTFWVEARYKDRLIPDSVAPRIQAEISRLLVSMGFENPAVSIGSNQKLTT